eukprot:scaffold6581_cov57-Attheya_sp.AAC.19
MSAPVSTMQNLLPDLASVTPGSERRSLREKKLPMTPNFATRAQPNGLPMLPALGSIEKEHRGLTLGNNSIQSLVYTNRTGHGPRLQVLDHNLLAKGKQVYIDILRAEQAWWVINKDQIQGDQVIANVATLAIALDLSTNERSIKVLNKIHGDGGDTASVMAYVKQRIDYLRSSSPTNTLMLENLDQLLAAAQKTADKTAVFDLRKNSPQKTIIEDIVRYAEFMLSEAAKENM